MFQLDLAQQSQTAYTSSVVAVTAFASWIESQSLPPNQGYGNYDRFAATFNPLKQDTMPWFNKVYPSCAQIMQQLVQADNRISPPLATLQSLAAQLQGDSGNIALHTGIVQAAGNLNNSVVALEDSLENTVTPLTQSANTLSSDLQNLIVAAQQLETDEQSLNYQLYQLEGQLSHLHSATCLSQSAINNCEQQIQTIQNELNTVAALDNLGGRAAEEGNGAVQGLAFMGGYLSQAQAMCGQVQQALGRVLTDPVIMLQMDLQQAQQGWQAMLQMAEATLGQTAALKLL